MADTINSVSSYSVRARYAIYDPLLSVWPLSQISLHRLRLGLPYPKSLFSSCSRRRGKSEGTVRGSSLLRVFNQDVEGVAAHFSRNEPTPSDLFVAYLLARNIRYEEDLVDQLFNSSEKRLARVLLMLAHFGKEGIPESVIPKLSQETLAEMVGTTRSRVSFFMNRFRKLGFIDYGGSAEGGLQVYSSLLNVVLHD